MIKVRTVGELLEKTKYPFESYGVLPPLMIREGEQVHLYYHAGGPEQYPAMGYCRVTDPTEVAKRWDQSKMFPEIERSGMKDPRIAKIEGYNYLSYSRYDEINSRSDLCISEDIEGCSRNLKRIGRLSIALQTQLPLTCYQFQSQTRMSKTKRSKQYSIPERDRLFRDTLHNYYSTAKE